MAEGRSEEGIRDNAQDSIADSQRHGAGAWREGADAMSAAARSGGDMISRGWQTGAATVGQGLQAASDGQQQFAERAVGQLQQLTEAMVRATAVYSGAANRTAEDMQAIAGAVQATTQSIQQAQRAWMGWVSRAAQSGLRLPLDLMQCSTLHHLAEVQSRFMQEAVSDMVEGSAEMLRTTSQLAQNALGPLEERVHEGGDGHAQGKVSDIMSRDVTVISPDDTIQEAARRMAADDAGILPVGENDRLVGMLSDRDIAVRMAAEGKEPGKTKVRDVMTPEVKYCFDDQDIGDLADNMASLQVRRLPVINRQKRLVGIVSIGDLATQEAPIGAEALRGIARPGGQHTQAQHTQARQPQRSHAGGRSRRKAAQGR
jgi:CBS domain-containing protein